MAFTLVEWKKRVQENLVNWPGRMQQAGVNSIYAFISAASVWPIVQGMQQGEWAAMSALGGVVASLGTNLLANTIQSWKDEAHGAQQLEGQINDNAALRDELDEVLEELQALEAAREDVTAEQQSWFAQTLAQELTLLGNLPRFETVITGGGDFAAGDLHKTIRGVHFEGGEVKIDGPVAGDRVVQAGIYAEHYHEAEKSADKKSSIKYLSSAQEQEDREQLRTYLDMTIRQSGGVTLAPLDKAAKERRFLALKQLFINLDTGPSKFLFADRPGEYAITSTIGQIHANRRLILLGDPGSGKTTILRYLGLCLAGACLEPESDWLDQLNWGIYKAEQKDKVFLVDRGGAQDVEKGSWQAPAVIPVYVTLRHFARTEFDPHDPQAIWKFVCKNLEREKLAETIPVLQRKANRGELIFLFDGVDEVPSGQRADIWQAIASMNAGSCGGNRWVTTCRIKSFNESELPESGIPVRTVQPLQRSQIEEFIAHWYSSLAEAGELSQSLAAQKNKTTASSNRTRTSE